MSDGLRRLPPKFLTDSEQFHGSGIESPLGLRDYWRWSASSLMDNTARGLVAEFLVATALKTYIPDRPRVEWDPYDFEAEIDDPRVSIEVKSSAYVQSWKQEKYSNLQFNIRATFKWNPETGKYSNEPCRADLYVFCALVEKKVRDQAAVLNTDKWRFRVVSEGRASRPRDHNVEPSGAGGVRIRALAAQRIVEEGSLAAVVIDICQTWLRGRRCRQRACEVARTCWGSGSSGFHPGVRTSAGVRFPSAVRGRTNQRQIPASL